MISMIFFGSNLFGVKLKPDLMFSRLYITVSDPDSHE